MSSEKITLANAALHYLERGWIPIPCKARGKEPLIKWAEFRDKAPSPAQVTEWWRRWPDANIALVCGRVSGLVVVDVDTDRGGSPEGQPYTGIRAKTGGGGYHLFYEFPGDKEHVQNQVGKDGLDVRADGGYVIVAPSVHPNGKRYEWQTYDGLGHAPEWALQAPQKEREHSGKQKWLLDLLQGGTSSGSRNDDTARLAGYYAGKGLPVDVVEQLVQEWMRKQGDPLHPDEVSVTVRSVFRTEVRNNKKPKKKTEERGPLSAISFMEYSLKHGTGEEKWLVKDWIPDSTIAFASSPPGSRKTWSMFDLAVSVAGGLPFYDQFEVNETGPVLIFQQEDYHGQVAERINVIALGKMGATPCVFSEDGECSVPVVPPLPIYLHEDRLLRFDNPEIIEEFEKLIGQLKPKLVIIDPLYSAVSTDDYMTKGAEDMFVMKRLRDQYKCSFFIAHHTKKSSDSFNRQDMWGSQFLNAFLETGWQMRPHNEDDSAAVVNRHFKNAGPQPSQKVHFDIDTGDDFVYKVTVTEATEEEVSNAASREGNNTSASHQVYLDLITSAGKAGISQQSLSEETGKNKSSISRACKALEKSGDIMKQSGRWVCVDEIM